MNILITHAERVKDHFYFQATCEKVSAFVSIASWGFQVCCQNASHGVWRKCGKHFPTLAEALENYKSPEMKAIIQAAADAAGAKSVTERLRAAQANYSGLFNAGKFSEAAPVYAEILKLISEQEAA